MTASWMSCSRLPFTSPDFPFTLGTEFSTLFGVMSKIAEDIKPITYLKTHSAELVNSVVSRRASVVITQNGEPRVIVQDIQSFEKDRKALLLLKLISQGVLDAEAGDLIEQDVLFDRLEKKLLKTASR